MGGPRGIPPHTGSEPDNSICGFKGVPKTGPTGMCPQARRMPLRALGHALEKERRPGQVTPQLRAYSPLQKVPGGERAPPTRQRRGATRQRGDRLSGAV